MRYLSVDEVVEIYYQVMAQSGGLVGILDIGLLESALSQHLMTFGGQSLYPTLIEKASALGFALIKNHPFLDGNKRIGHASMEIFLVLNRDVIVPLWIKRKKPPCRASNKQPTTQISRGCWK